MVESLAYHLMWHY